VPLYRDVLPPGSRILDSYEHLRTDGDLTGLREEIAVSASRSRELLSRATAETGESASAWRAAADAFRTLERAVTTGGKEEEIHAAIRELQGILTRGAGKERAWEEWERNAHLLLRLKDGEQKRIEREHTAITTDKMLQMMGLVGALAVRFIRDRKDLAAFEHELSAIIEGEPTRDTTIHEVAGLLPPPKP
jgi:hypothetical protein